MRVLGAVFDGFKSIENSDLRLDGVVVLFGANGAGKSNAIEGVEALFENLKGNDEAALGRVRLDPGQDLGDHYAYGGLIVEFPDSEIPDHADHEIVRTIFSGAAQRVEDEWDNSLLETNESFIEHLDEVRKNWTTPSRKPSLEEGRTFWARVFCSQESHVPPADRQQLCREIVRTQTFYLTPQDISPVVLRKGLSEAALRTAEAIGEADGQGDPLAHCCLGLISGPDPMWYSRWPLTPPISPLFPELRMALGNALPELTRLDTAPENVEGDIYRSLLRLAHSPDPVSDTRKPLPSDKWISEVHATAVFGTDPMMTEPSRLSVTPDPWLEESGAGAVQVSAEIVKVGRLVAEVANLIALSFIRDRGRIGLEFIPPTIFEHFPARLRVVFSENDGRKTHIASVGSGVGRWISAACREACRRLEEISRFHEDLPDNWAALQAVELDRSRTSTGMYKEMYRELLPLPVDGEGEVALHGPIDPRASMALADSRRVLYLVDEPEAHLHPQAATSIGLWLIEIGQRNAGVLVATHSTAFLDLPSQAARLVLAQKGDEPSLIPMEKDLLTILGAHAENIGLTAGELMQLTRGVLVVEGKHDEMVLMHFFGGELAEGRLAVLPLSGAYEALALIEAELLARLGKRLIILFDNVRGQELRKALHGRSVHFPKDQTHEEMILAKLITFAQDKKEILSVLDNPFPDIVCALPDSTVAKVLQADYKVTFPGWKPLLQGYRQSRKGNFKKFFVQSLHIPESAGDPAKVVGKLIVAGLREAGDEPPPRELTDAIRSAVALANDDAPPARRDLPKKTDIRGI